VSFDGIPTVYVDPNGQTYTVSGGVDDLPVVVTNDPLPVDAAVTASIDDSGYFANAVYLGLGLLVFLVAVRLVHGFRSRRG